MPSAAAVRAISRRSGAAGSQMCAVLQHYQAARLARSSVSIGAPRIIRPLRAAGRLRGSSGSQMCAALQHYQAARLARSSVDRCSADHPAAPGCRHAPRIIRVANVRGVAALQGGTVGAVFVGERAVGFSPQPNGSEVGCALG